MEDDNVRLRAACDRCHSQKLKCSKPPGMDVCSRCARARTNCVFRPFRQKKEPKSDSTSPSTEFQLPQPEEQPEDLAEVDASSMNLANSKRKRTGSLVEDIDPRRLLKHSDTHINQSSLDAIDMEWTAGSSPLLGHADCAFNELDFGNAFPMFDFSIDTLPTSPDTYFLKPKGIIQRPAFDAFSLPDEVMPAASQMDLSFVPPRQPPLIDQKTPTGGREPKTNITYSPPKRALVHQLSALSVGLYDHINTIPSLFIHDAFPRGHDSDRPGDYQEFNVDETFRLTQDLVDIYPVFIENFLKRPHSPRTSPPLQGIVFNDQQDLIRYPPDPPDHSSILLFLSCHVRLLDIFEEIFKHVEYCMVPGSELYYTPPRLRIGNYTAPPETAKQMQIMLLIRLANQLDERASDFAAQIRRPGHDEKGTRDDIEALTIATSESVKTRAGNMARKLNGIFTALQGTAYLMS